MRRPDESMTLLTEVVARPLDGGYAEAAARKRAGTGRSSPGGWAFVLVVALVLGVAVTWGVKVLRTPVEADQRAREALERSAGEARDRVAVLRDRAAELSGRVEALQNELLEARDPSAAADARQLAAAVGAVAVQGPGLRISIAPDQAAVAAGNSEARIRSGDLRLVVGALWQAGAEAVAVGGVRLTSLTAIRDVGDQIQVAFEAVPSPCVIEAIGPAADLEVGLASGRAGDRISLLKGYFGATVTIEQVQRLELPASPAVTAFDPAGVM